MSFWSLVSGFKRGWLARLRPLCFALLLGGWAAPAARAQQVLVAANVAEDTLKNTFGPNRRYFAHAYLGYGLVAGPAGTGAAVRYGPASGEVQVGGRLKRRLTQTFALNLDLRYAYLRQSLAQNAAKTLPTAARHRRESLGFHQIQPEISLRINAGPRGNVVGHYLDLLAWGSLVAATNHVTEDDPAANATQVETTETGLDYLGRIGGGVGARLGTSRYALAARYRLSSVFAPGYAASWPELPRWVLGLEIGVF